MTLKGYKIYTTGEVYSLRLKRYMAPSKISSGYMAVNLTTDKKHKVGLVHRLLAKQFIPNPQNYPCVNHIDGNKLNNSLDNLEWCTYRQNTLHAFATGLRHNHYPRPARRKCIEAVKPNTRVVFPSINEAAQHLNILRTSISNSLTGRAKTAGGYSWHYL